MTDFIFNNIFFILIAALITLGFIVFSIAISRSRTKAGLFSALGLILYELHFPEEESAKEGEKKNLKELIFKMEQFLSGMTALAGKTGFFQKAERPYFSLELALKEAGEEIVFYAAAPKSQARLFEKQTEALFPGVNLFIQENDYNIFNPQGFHACSYAMLKDSPILPIKTYQELESDPLEVIINSFSKLKAKGEGAALQILIQPAEYFFKQRLRIALSALRNGVPLNEAKRKKPSRLSLIINPESMRMLSSFVEGINNLFFSPAKKEEQKSPFKFDESAIKLLEKKSGREPMAVNFRLIASAATENEANTILRELESAFLQFNDPLSNNFDFIRLRGKSQKETLTNFSFRVFSQKQKIYLNTQELSSIYHFPIKPSGAPHLKILKAKSAPPPLELPKEGTLLGINSFRGKDTEAKMQINDRRRHLYIVGQTGTGKSNLMENMAEADIKNGAGICVIDPHGSLVDAILSKIPEERADDVIYFDPANTKKPIGLNMMEYDPEHPEQKTFIVNEIYDIFRKLWKDVPEAFGPMFEQYYRNATLLVLEDPFSGNTLLDVNRVLSDQKFRDFKLSRTQNPILKSFWHEIAEKAGGEAALANIVPYITSKFDTFLNNEIMRPILIQEKSALNFRKIMDEGKILLVNLSKGRLGDLNAHLIGLIMVGKILMAALSRADRPEESRRDFFLYLDEFQNITTKSIATILSEARKYRLNLTIAHQFIGQLEEEIKKAVFGNVGSMAIFRVGAEDAEFLEKQLLPVFGKQDLINIDNFNAYVKLLANNQTTKPFNIAILQASKGNEEKARALKEMSALKYGRPREEIEEEIKRKFAGN